MRFLSFAHVNVFIAFAHPFVIVDVVLQHPVVRRIALLASEDGPDFRPSVQRPVVVIQSIQLASVPAASGGPIRPVHQPDGLRVGPPLGAHGLSGRIITQPPPRIATAGPLAAIHSASLVFGGRTAGRHRLRFPAAAAQPVAEVAVVIAGPVHNASHSRSLFPSSRVKCFLHPLASSLLLRQVDDIPVKQNCVCPRVSTLIRTAGILLRRRLNIQGRQADTEQNNQRRLADN